MPHEMAEQGECPGLDADRPPSVGETAQARVQVKLREVVGRREHIAVYRLDVAATLSDAKLTFLDTFVRVFFSGAVTTSFLITSSDSPQACAA
ncbi:hypothetical protein ACN27G_15510 [Plantactinospora sp. WMMB334]|uniref:hypothetical protein n=1 Tax=Plantactinospora sp. WMMB334 TaxID=3404119 RepID=UPI003B9607A2